MNEERQRAYLELIQALLQCEGGQEPALLEANAELVDGGLVATMREVAAFLENEGQGGQADWLRAFAAQLSQVAPSGEVQQRREAYIELIKALFFDQSIETVFVLLYNAGTDNEGIHTISHQERHTVLMFESSADATNFAQQLGEHNFPVPSVEALKTKTIISFCEEEGYDWEFVPEGANRTPPVNGEVGDKADKLETAMEGSVQTSSTKKERQQAYLELIQALLQCESGQELALLEANAELVDGGLVATMREVAAFLENEGRGGQADWLRAFAAQLSQVAPSGEVQQRREAYIELIKALFACDQGREAEILQANSELVDGGLVATMREVAAALLAQGQENNGRWLSNLADQLEPALASLPSLEGSGVGHSSEGSDQTSSTNEEKQQAYLELIQALLQCESGQEVALLEANIELVDAGLVSVMKQWADLLEQQGESNNGRRWLLNMAQRLEQFLEPPRDDQDKYTNFLQALLETVEESRGNHQAIYPLLDNNLHLIDENLVRLLQTGGNQIKEQASPEEIYQLGTLLYYLASAFDEFPTGNPGINLAIAIYGYEFCTQTERQRGSERNLSKTLNNLGVAYLTQAQLGINPVESVTDAIASHREAALIFRQQGSEQDLSTTLNNLGVAYKTQAKLGINPAENLTAAITAYKEAALIFRQQGSEQDLSKTLNNLGVAYKAQAQLGINPAENLTAAITAYQEAAQILRQPGLERDLSTTLSNLGVAYLTQAELSNLGVAYLTQAELGINPAEKLSAAIAAHEEAVQLLRQPGLERNLSGTLNNLGIVYTFQAQLGINPQENLRAAIAAYQEAAQVRCQLGLERDLSGTLNNLGGAYLTQAELGINPQENLSAAIGAYQGALGHFNPALLPVETLGTGRNLGNLGFKQGDWDIAIEGYSAAVEAVEQSRAWATSEKRRQEIVRESIGVYENLIQAAVNQGNLTLALQTVERSRSKRLADLILVGDLYADGNIPPEIQAWHQQLQASRQLKTQLQQDSFDRPEDAPKALASANRNLRASLADEQLRAAEAAEREAWAKLYEFDAITARLQQPQPLPELDNLKALIPNAQTALLSFYTTDAATHIFILRRPAQGVSENWVHCHSLPHADGAGDLQSWLVDNWVNPYIRINQGETQEACHRRRDDWHQTMPERLQELAARLEVDALIENHLQGIADLILIPHLFLHQIPFDLLPTGAQSDSPPQEGLGVGLLGDRFRIHYIPSANILDLCQQRKATQPTALGIVENTTGDLTYTPLECEWVAQTWNVNPIHRLQGQAATPETYQQLLGQVEALLSSHHATSRPDDPLASHLSLANDQKITLRDLLSPLWRFPQLTEVFLSCCETGLSFAIYQDEQGEFKRESIDEPLSLGAGFLIAGARAVISTHWAVSDLATTLFSREYHRARQEGQERLTALHRARQVLRTKTQQDWLRDLTADYQQAEQTYRQLRRANDPNTDAAKTRYKAIAEINNWLLTQNEEIPFQGYRYWGAFHCLGLP